jgi:hypothetical protein
MYELKQHKPWFDEERLGSLDRRKQIKMQCLQDLNQNYANNLNNIRREARALKKRRKYLIAKIDCLEDKKISETSIGASVILRWVTSLKLLQYRMRRVIW